MREVLSVPALAEFSRRERENGVCRSLFRRREAVAVQFKEQDADNETRPLIAVDKRMVIDDRRRVGGRHVDQIGAFTIGR